MKQSIRNALYQAILDNHWVDIKYKNQKKEDTHFYAGISDIDVDEGKLYCDIFNAYKSHECIGEIVPITLDNIYYARVIDQSYYPTPKPLLSRLDYDKDLLKFLEVSSMDNDILRYLSQCFDLDNDPYIKDKTLLNGVDCEELLKETKYQLDEKQFETLLNKLFKADIYDGEKIVRYSKDIAINVFSIDISGKQYVVAYHSIGVNFKDKTLKMKEKININKSFLIDEAKKATLSQYLDISADDFCAGFLENQREYIELIRGNFRNNERVDTSPEIFVIERKIQAGVDRTFEEIHRLEDQNSLTFPLKSFFGRNRAGSGSNKETNIVVFDKNKVNIDQMRVIYNSMVNHVTYVKGPPGTGKTETIFNVLLSAYYNDKKVLVCSNNNHPVNDIFNKMTGTLYQAITQREDRKDFIFPIIRLGNNDELLITMQFLINCYNFAMDSEKILARDVNTEKAKNDSLEGFQKLRERLQEYEERIDLEEKVEKLIKLKALSTSDKISKALKEQIAVQTEKINKMHEPRDEDVAKYSISASESEAFQDYVYYSSIVRLRKLLNPTYKDLIAILKMGATSEAVSELNKYLRIDLNFRRFTDVFPIVITTNVSADKLGGPNQHFDLCIMDESGQCNVAVSLIPIIRAENLLLVGDTNQLQPVTVIETDVNENLMEKYNIKKEYNYVKNSILSTMLSKDNNSKSILLRYHYRCGRKIAQFVNSRFYEEQLKLLNKNQGSLLYLNVKNNRKIPGLRNACHEEATEIVKLIKENEYKDVGIVTPFVNQAALINEYLVREGISLNKIKAGTIHTLQGSERSVIIMSSALSLRTGKKTMEWIKNNHELINVAVTRAKETFVFAGDKEAIDVLSKNETNDIKALSDYVASNGLMQVPPSDVRISTDFSNDSDSEKEFFETVTPYFTRRGSKLRIERNVPVNEAIKAISDEDLEQMGQKEFDVVVRGALRDSLFSRPTYRTILVFEIDGGEHIGNRATIKRDRVKEEICKKYNIKMIRIANSDVKDYQLIIHLFESIIKGIPDLEAVGEQLSLFDEE